MKPWCHWNEKTGIVGGGNDEFWSTAHLLEKEGLLTHIYHKDLWGHVEYFITEQGKSILGGQRKDQRDLSMGNETKR
jgi:hypothetical protein